MAPLCYTLGPLGHYLGALWYVALLINFGTLWGPEGHLGMFCFASLGDFLMICLHVVWCVRLAFLLSLLALLYSRKDGGKKELMNEGKQKRTNEIQRGQKVPLSPQ